MFTQEEFDAFFGPKKTVSRYPLTDVSVDEAGNAYIEVALAGFTQDEIEIEQNGDKLIISGEKESTNGREYFGEKMISTRSFERVMRLAPKFAEGVGEATFENGILTVKLTPVEPKRNLIPIG